MPEEIESTPAPLGPVTTPGRGFEIIEFIDYYGAACTVQQSSIALNDQPGSGALWLGVADADPQVMARDAERLGVPTNMKVGWVPYPVPPEVLLKTRMHLEREQVRSLIVALQHWVDTGHLPPS